MLTGGELQNAMDEIRLHDIGLHSSAVGFVLLLFSLLACEGGALANPNPSFCSTSAGARKALRAHWRALASSRAMLASSVNRFDG